MLVFHEGGDGIVDCLGVHLPQHRDLLVVQLVPFVTRHATRVFEEACVESRGLGRPGRSAPREFGPFSSLSQGLANPRRWKLLAASRGQAVEQRRVMRSDARPMTRRRSSTQGVMPTIPMLPAIITARSSSSSTSACILSNSPTISERSVRSPQRPPSLLTIQVKLPAAKSAGASTKSSNNWVALAR